MRMKMVVIILQNVFDKKMLGITSNAMDGGEETGLGVWVKEGFTCFYILVYLPPV
jgi:hypothetical protein